jgi:signal transduction histidine kinase
MSAIASWARKRRPELAWAAFAAANFAVLFVLLDYQTVPFHVVWVSLTLLYGFRVWRLPATLLVLIGVCGTSTIALGSAVLNGDTGADELTEVPLMGAMFLAMVWHARRREAALKEASRAAQRERAFIRDVSHQLKTPLAVARGLVDLLAEPIPSRDRSLDLADLTEELERLGRVAQGLVLLEMAEQPDALEIGAIDVEDLVVAAARRWSHSAQRTWRVAVEVYGYVPGDRQRLDSALDAIVENAVQATEERDVISLIAKAAGDDAIIRVVDSGTGIAPDFLPRMFERFTRSGDARSPGSGLGLPIVRAIARAHGGDVIAESVVGRGTTVSILLPDLVALGTPLPAP